MAGQDDKTMDNTIDQLKESVESLLTAGAIGGSVGATWGICLATFRSQPLGFYAASLGTTFALASISYMTFFDVLKRNRGGSKDDVSTYILPGIITGGGMLSFTRIPIRAVQGSIAGGIIGFGAYFADKKFQSWRHTKSLERYEAKHGIAPEPTMQLNGRVESTSTPSIQGDRLRFDIPDLLPAFVKISDDEIESRIQKRLEELRLESQK
ncbi:hypothetical protein THRCLA_00547 [Thraustotheca clavata]|uniref:Uncharacterized protein n=1 Tax=Thraustotheca clavata TaxID=74557 RepID=A0A1W0ABP6_9STRA|nr:hypothetical protein THRCLA_00547 [Thraustotheca clavata]